MEQRTTKWYQDMDKVAKIREEIERLKKCSESAKMEWIPAGYNENAFAEDCRIASFNKLLFFIDSMQEEPVKIKKGCKYRCICNVTNNDTGNISFVAGKIYLAPEDDTLVSEENGWLCDTSKDASNFELVEEPVSIWHDASEKPERDDLLIETNDGRIIHRQSINNYGMVKRWAYTSDLLNLDNSCNFGNNLQEEPVGDDLGEYINKLSKQFQEVSFAKLSRIAVRVAKWQEKQDQKTIELAEDHAMLAGMEKMKEEMMSKAGNGRVNSVSNRQTRAHITVVFDSPRDIEVLDRLKVIVIKEYRV